MKILVSTKHVPDAEQRLRIAPSGREIDRDGVTYILNPFDAIALEEALCIRENTADPVEVIAISVGRGEPYDEPRTALAMGADRAMLVTAEQTLDPWNVTRVLAEVVHREQPDLVLMGKQATDDDSNQVGQFLAAILDWPQATFASKIELADRQARVERETDAGIETVVVTLPALITVDLRLNEPRYASLPALMKAKKRPVERLSVDELGVTIEPRLEIVQLEAPISSRRCIRVESVAELVDRLRTEAKVI
jgi:electron transfer flavoprotein beta subunit